jgi:hypothetical protein
MSQSPALDLPTSAENPIEPKTGNSRRRVAGFLAASAWLCLVAAALALPGSAQSAVSEPAAAAAETPLSLVRWNGSLPEAAGRAVEVRFALYQDQAGGSPLWNETQVVKVSADGRYTVLLGAMSAEGLPQTLFQAGGARWIEAQLANGGGEAPANPAAPARSLLAAVPYAFKASDAETLAGRSAADYVTREDLQSAVAATVQTPPNAHPETNPTGTGTAGKIPVWTGASILGNSVITESGTKIGIGTATPATTLDVDGLSTLRGFVSLPPAAAATKTAGASSPGLEWGASTWSSTTNAAVAQNFEWKAVSAGNNTTAPTANLELLFGKGTATLAATGLSVAPTGRITFAAGQTFPSTIKSVAATSPITATTTSGAVTLTLSASALETTLNKVYPQLSQGDIFKNYIEAYQAAGPGTAAVLGWGTNGSVGAFGDSDTGYGLQGESTSGHGVYAQVTTPAAGSAGVLGFTGTSFSGSYTSEAGIANAGVWADNSAAGAGVPVALFATGDNVYGAAIVTNGADYPALFVDNNGGTAMTASASSGDGVSASTSSGTGVYGSTSGSGDGVEGIASNLSEQQAGVVGVGNTLSDTGAAYNIYSGVWGDTGTSSTTVAPAWAIGVLGTADDGHAGVFLNNSTGFSTMYVSNASSGGNGLFKTVMAMSDEGTCGIGGKGDLSCTGQIKSLVSSGGGSRKVETYAVQSPENWMEDFGSGLLDRGVAVLKIDPAFAETVTADASYHVFITPNGDSKGLYVIRKTATSFEVRESGGGTSSLSFDYRIVAKRRGYESQRLTDVTEPYNEAARAAMTRATMKPAASPHRAPNRLAHPSHPARSAVHSLTPLHGSAHLMGGQTPPSPRP